MKSAWEFEHDIMNSSVPVILSEDEQSWLFSEQVEAFDDACNSTKWQSNTPGSGAREHIIIAAIQAMYNLGYDVTAAEALMEQGLAARAANNTSKLASISARVYHTLNQAQKVPSHPHWSYTVYETFEQYVASVKFPEYDLTITDKELEERTYYGWMAQICAAAAGTAIEGYTTDNIRKVFGELYGYPRKPNTYNDDITFEVAFLMALEEKMDSMTSADIAEKWLELVPFAWSAEDIALKNLKIGIYPPDSGKLYNPYREWIGAQMRGGICGMVAPANPRKAAYYAYMDAVISHHNNGVLGEVFNALLVSLAYSQSNIRNIVKSAISMIPIDSEYYSVISYALEQCESNEHWEAPWRACELKFKTYNWIHAYPNAAAEVIALWFGNGDFDETIHICLMEGYDVDCNAAQIACVLGVMLGRKSLSDYWTEPIGDVLNTYMRNLKVISIKELSKRTTIIAKKLMESK